MPRHMKARSIPERDMRLDSIMASTPKPAARLLMRYGRVPLSVWFVLSIALVSSAKAAEHSQAIIIRLLTPIASYSPAGTRFDTPG
jgi:hypothetical protein